MGEVEVSRRAVRHELVRRRNERIVETRDDSWPLRIELHPFTWEELVMDSDAAEAHTLDFEGRFFMNIVLLRDERIPEGEFRLVWPTADGEAVG